MSAEFLYKIYNEVRSELTENILPYWVDRVYQPKDKTFVGLIDFEEKPHPEHLKASIINSRILWTFSAAYRHFPDDKYREVADAAYQMLIKHFWDHEWGGVFWHIDQDLEPLDPKKQIYAQAFAIYGLAEYVMAFGSEQANQIAISLFMLIERYGFDPEHGGYIEALSRDWGPVGDQRLSSRDLDVKKSMNTHLHVLEAYTNLLRIWPDDELKQQMQALLTQFIDHIIDPERWQFKLFFDADWTSKTDLISYGHDIEGSWLLCEAVQVLKNEDLQKKIEAIAVRMARKVAEEGLDADGGLLYEAYPEKLKDGDKHWWPQNEAAIGFLNAYELSKDPFFLEKLEQSWNFMKKALIDQEHGEWHSRVSREGTRYPLPKVDEWKCPYHNGRFCIEIMTRIEKELSF
jgi:mannobiose 2-epimerase